MLSQIHVLTAGQNLVDTGDDFTRIYHVAQGKIEVGVHNFVFLSSVFLHSSVQFIDAQAGVTQTGGRPHITFLGTM